MSKNRNIEIASERIRLAKEQKSFYLDLSGLGLSKIPEDISEMNYLMEIDLSFNFFSELPEMITKMVNLHTINISNNYVSKIDFIFGNYYSLSRLDISNNYLYDIPESLSLLNSDIEIKFNNNPFLKNLPETLELYDIWTVKYYLNLSKEPENLEKLYETKLIFVGSGEVGKTTLIKTLKDEKFNVVVGEEVATPGINVDQMNFEVYFPAKEPHYSHFSEIDNLYREIYITKEEIEEDWDVNEIEVYERNGFSVYEDVYEYLSDLDVFDKVEFLNSKNFGDEFFISKNVTVNLWDFGGQEIYYSTHQFFLTRRSIYIFVWEPRRDDDKTDFEYWLNTIKLLGQESLVFIVMNKSDIRHVPINESNYLSLFPSIQGFYQISCLKKEGIYEFKNAIIEGIKKLPHLGKILPKTWLNLRAKLKNLERDFISFTEFRNICAENGISVTAQEIQLVSDYLHNIGDIIHFSNDGSLKNLVIINPKWATQAVYSLIDSIPIQKQNGLFNYADLENYLDLKDYPFETHHQLLQLMEKFNICFKLIGAQDLYIIPELLKDEIPNEEEFQEIVNADGLRFKITFTFMPKGLISKLICGFYNLLSSNNFWKNGVVLNYDMSKASILCKPFEKSLEIKIIGNPRRDLFTLIKNELSKIYLELNLKEGEDFFEEIPCNCDDCKQTKPYYFKYVVLKRYILKGKDTIECQNSTFAVKINDLLDLYRIKNTETKFIYPLLSAISQLQGMTASLNSDENSRNKFIASYLSSKEINAKDQSLWGRSSTGLKQGELDIKIESNEGDIITIFEGVNLTSVDTSSINTHIIKTINKYDVNGLPEKYFGVYYTGRSFDDFSAKYLEYIMTFNQEEVVFDNVFDETIQFTSHSEIKIFKAYYKKSGRKLSIIHLLINML
ncbi:COR domain-containing protein [Chryseobacterium aquaticum]|uniref:COR domain-containing protein n=1 Tax=Chryseobacterium aquaticum TaxID=452084 RepID=UPI003F729EAD